MAGKLQSACVTGAILFAGFQLVTGFGLAWPPLLYSQEISGTKPPDSDKSARPLTVVMVVKVAKEFTSDQIKATIRQGAKVLDSPLEEADVITKPVAREFYDLLATYTGLGGRSSQEASAQPVQISPLMSLSPTWVISFDSKKGDRLIKELDVEFIDGKHRIFPPKSPQPGDDSWLVAVRPGHEYTLRLPSGSTPKSYSMKYIDVTTGKEKEDNNQTWPVDEDQYYLLTIANFQGELDKLFEVIKEPSDPDAEAKVSNPFKDIRREIDIRMFLGSIGVELPDPPVEVEKNHLTLRQPTLPKRSPKRVWVLFPITESNLKTQIDEVKAISQKDLPDRIRKNSVPASKLDATITADSAPKWYELPKSEKKRFERLLLLNDWKGLQTAFPRVFQLIVWEFDDGQTVAPIVVNDEGRSSTFKTIEITNWPKGLEELKRFEEKEGAKSKGAR